jgi:hypothetical protein
VVSVEDLLVDRLGAWASWKSGIDGANAFQLYRACREEIDENRLTRRASESGFDEAMRALRSFDDQWSESEPGPKTLERWANNGPDQEAS